MAAALYDPGQHRALQARPWSESGARAAIAALAADAIAAYQGSERLWPNTADDLEGEPDRPHRNVYFGAAGVAWALHRLAADGLAPELPALAELADGLPGGFRAAPELVALAPPPAPSILFGESGILLAAEAIRPHGARRDALHDCVRRNARNPTLELCWGSPGTMISAYALWRATGEERWGEAWRDSADWLLGEWRDTVWTQDLYGETARYTGAGHGFAGNAFALLGGLDLLDAARGAALAARIAAVVRELALVDGDVAQWHPLVGAADRRPLQWCHGSPGMVVSLAGLPSEPELDRLLLAGGELTWRAGPLVKGPGLCHGTAGNAYAFLALYARSGDERWLARARAFAMDALDDVDRRRAARGRGRYALFTGDLGVALLLRGCLRADPTFPFLAGW